MKNDKTFAISAKTCTLKYNSQEGKSTILDNETKFVIPIYQRPYSWTDGQLQKFVFDIFNSFWGNDGNSIEEPMFIGTMQLSTKNNNHEQEIIDGQQRLTTFLILIKVLKIRFPNCEELSKITLDWLSTKVNNGKQQFYLQEVITSNLILNDETLNPYLKNAYLINELIDEQIKDEEGNPLLFDIDKFVKHLLSNVYFVVIETQAGLSKTLQIFDAINTTGLDLNGGDIFKIRMYEYLTSKKGKEETVFDEISNLYHLIDENNSILKYNAADMSDILSIYQYILIAKYSLPIVLYRYRTDTFFENLFDTILGNQLHDHFRNNVNSVELSIEDIESIIEVRYKWQKKWDKTENFTAETACAFNLIWMSRYGRHWTLTFVFLYMFKNDEDYWNKMLLFTRQLCKLYTIYSIRFLKAINEVHSFTYSLIKKIIDGSFEEVMSLLNNKIGKLENHKGWGDFEMALKGDITYNTKIKNIICRLSAMLEEDYKTSDESQIEKIRKSLFETAIDIEHIQSYHDSNGVKREEIWDEWQENINSIGNLMILEQEINRSISNNPYKVKIQRYPESNFSIVKNQSVQYSNWDLEMCLLRKEKETQKILDYIFN